jgi:broad specificity phosphatase PhoE
MKEFWFIRHGESETNIGKPVESDLTTRLTEKGQQQAKYVADGIQESPDLFVVSPYLRTSQTAEPTLEKFPGIPIETWPIHEFSYLSHSQYAGTTTKDRRKLSVRYFWKSDPDLILGDGGESFNQFIGRVQNCFDRLLGSKHNRIILFGHGWFTRAGLWLLLRDAETMGIKSDLMSQIKSELPNSGLFIRLYEMAKNKTDMRSFLLFSAGIQTANCSILKYQLADNSHKLKLSGFDTSHLPEEFRKTSLRNR